jgi:hypothetical protein
MTPRSACCLIWLKHLTDNRHFWLHQKIEKKIKEMKKEEKKCEEIFHHEQYLSIC